MTSTWPANLSAHPLWAPETVRLLTPPPWLVPSDNQVGSLCVGGVCGCVCACVCVCVCACVWVVGGCDYHLGF